MRVALARLEAIGIFVGSFAVAALVIAKRTYVEQHLGAVGPMAYPIAIVIFAIVASAPFSVTDALAIMNGVIFGPLWGSVVNALGIVLAAIIGYILALRTSRLLDLDAQLVKLPKWVRHFRIGSPMFLIVVRFIPGLGGTLATQTAAALRVPILIHIFTMAVVAVPICTVLAVFGHEAADWLQSRVVVPAQTYMKRHTPHLPHRHHPGETPTP